MLFDNLHKVSRQYLESFAQSLNLDMDEFSQCLLSGEKEAKVMADFREAVSYGIRGTPTFIINGDVYVGARQFTEFRQIIDSELGR
jgi:predicted DsbA family dithiol-disulfide isomerase